MCRVDRESALLSRAARQYAGRDAHCL